LQEKVIVDGGVGRMPTTMTNSLIKEHIAARPDSPDGYGSLL
jgi:hypothetical protein